MVTFGLLVSVAFAVLSSEHDTPKARFRYGMKVFGYFVGLGFLVAWFLYPLPL